MTVSRIFNKTCDHLRPNGVELYYVTYSVACSPADALSDNSMYQQYPLEKLLSFRQIFTLYDGFQFGDYLEMNNKRYAVRVVNQYEELTPMDEYFQLIVEEKHGS